MAVIENRASKRKGLPSVKTGGRPFLFIRAMEWVKRYLHGRFPARDIRFPAVMAPLARTVPVKTPGNQWFFDEGRLTDSRTMQAAPAGHPTAQSVGVRQHSVFSAPAAPYGIGTNTLRINQLSSQWAVTVPPYFSAVARTARTP